MDNRDDIINDLAVENVQMRLTILNQKYEIIALKKQIEELQKKVGDSNEN